MSSVAFSPLALLSGVVALLVARIFWLVLFHPLRNVPGPFLAKVTDIWHLVQCWGGKRHNKLVELHKRYGPFVRLGPNTVSTNTSSAIPAIYSAKSPTIKSAFYNAFSPGFPSSFTTNDKIYREKKHILSSAFAVRKLEAMEPLIRVHVDEFCEKVAKVGQVNLPMMISALTIDVLSDLCFGKCFDTLNNEQELDRIVDSMERSVELVLREGTMHKWPRFVWKFLHSKEDVTKRSYLQQKAVGAMMEQAQATRTRDDIFSNILEARRPETGEPYSQIELMGESILLLVAGSDTTSTALTVILWHLLANPQIMQKLKDEVCGKFHSAADIKTQELRNLPYLHAVIEEGLRICPPNPGLIPRLVVDRGAGHLVIDDHVFPPGTEIGVCNLSLHRNPKYFDEPDSYIPERWLENSSYKCDKNAFSPFSYGPRSCLGRNMAYMEMSLTLALIAFHLELSFVDAKQEIQKGFDVDDAFVALKPNYLVNIKKE